MSATALIVVKPVRASDLTATVNITRALLVCFHF